MKQLLLVKEQGEKEWSLVSESKAKSWKRYFDQQIRRMNTMFKNREYKIISEEEYNGSN